MFWETKKSSTHIEVITFLYRIRGLSVFIGKNSKALKRRKHKGFCVFLLCGMMIAFLEQGENKAKKGLSNL